ncbi:N-acetyltransferase [Capsaspora owczarzaki ATCC 30864]|uniref:N-acetyltransferase n=1 Tax=Capsaspora owczarzaki (strain ATCC 30864) TaxID=595528 RepID=UPI0001FE45A7|nr:N-acetyltransferase [Capsaspora owczarzaki ATCC 30864]|eukprot:XP_004347583.1 N-acetyltransferase [Capsaspora owczarzaki ATCC 30864]
MITVRPGLPKDLPAVLGLINELAVFERCGKEVETTVEQMHRDAFERPEPVFRFFVAIDTSAASATAGSNAPQQASSSAAEDGTVVGTAIYFYTYSTWKGRCLYLEDLVITESRRRQGIGRHLFDAVMAQAKQDDVARVMWQVLDWNEPAICFYKSLSADLDSTWVNCRLVRDQIQSYKPTARPQPQ